MLRRLIIKVSRILSLVNKVFLWFCSINLYIKELKLVADIHFYHFWKDSLSSRYIEPKTLQEWKTQWRLHFKNFWTFKLTRLQGSNGSVWKFEIPWKSRSGSPNIILKIHVFINYIACYNILNIAYWLGFCNGRATNKNLWSFIFLLTW